MNSPLGVTFTRREFAELLPIENTGGSVPAGHVGGRTLASLISAGTELGYGYQGQNFPTRTGYASVFQVEEVAPGVENVQVGDVVLAMGEHRSYQVHPANDVWHVQPVFRQPMPPSPD